MKGLSLLDCLNATAIIANDKNMTREQFGKIMHDDAISEKEKLEYLEKVITAGGYENLP